VIALRTFACLAGMLVAAAGLAAGLIAAGAALQPASSPAQVLLLLAGLLMLSAGHALRSRPEVRAVAVAAAPSRSGALRRDLAVVGTGAVVLVAFGCPSWRSSELTVDTAERHDLLFASDRPRSDLGRSEAPDRFDQEIQVISPRPLKAAAAAGEPFEAREVPGSRLALRALQGLAGGPVRFTVGGEPYAWPLPGAKLPVSPPGLEPRILGIAPLLPTAAGPGVLPLERTADPEPPAYDDTGKPWGDYAIFLTGTPAGGAEGPSPGVRALPSLSSAGGATGFQAPDGKGGDDFAVALTRGSDGHSTTVEYAWVRFGAGGLPALVAGGGNDEPLDALGESRLRRVPRALFEHYALRWRRAAAGSPRLALLPAGGYLFDAARRSPRVARALDVPRGMNTWEPLGVVALLLLLRRFR